MNSALNFNFIEMIRSFSYTRPKDNTVIWRYMDMGKFVSLLTMGLNFTNPNYFEDPFECAKCTENNLDKWINDEVILWEEKILEAVSTIEDEKNPFLLDKLSLRSMLEAQVQKCSNSKLKNRLLVSCWFGGKEESDAMWKLYAGSCQYGIAVKTTVGELQKAFNSYFNAEVVNIAKVKYVDYEKDHVGIDEVAWCKRKAYKHENEIRAILKYIGDDKNCVEGKMSKVYLKMPLHDWVKSIVLAPFATATYYDTIRELLNRFGYKDIEVINSSLSVKPII